MAEEDMMYPDPKIPLTPGQIVRLGGVFVFRVKHYGAKEEKYAEYEVTKFVWIDPCKNESVPLLQYRNFTKYFDVIEDIGVAYIVVPKLDKINEIVYVPAIASIFAKSVIGGLFWFKVPVKLYHEVLKAGDQIDKYFKECRKKRRMKVRKLESEIHIDLSDKSINKLAEAISTSLSKVLAEAISSIVKELALVQTGYQQPRKLSEEEMQSVALLTKLKNELLRMKGVLDVRISGNEITVFCEKDAVPKIMDVLSDNGLEVFYNEPLEYTAIVKARLKS